MSSNRQLAWIVVGVVVGSIAICGGVLAFLSHAARPNARVEPPPVTAPTGPLVLDQTLEFSDGVETMQGCSFLARTPGGSVIIVTAAHFLDFEGPALVRLTAFAGEEAATSTVAFGPPGNAGEHSAQNIDLRMDHLLLLPEREPTGATVLEIDDRAMPKVGERVWMPDAISAMLEPPGVLLHGVVTEVATGYVLIAFDAGQVADLMGLSGSPVISQATGKVVGLLSRGGELDGRTHALLTPALGLLRAMREAERSGERPQLSACVGKVGAKR